MLYVSTAQAHLFRNVLGFVHNMSMINQGILVSKLSQSSAKSDDGICGPYDSGNIHIEHGSFLTTKLIKSVIKKTD